jgi:hypothetical protein
MVNKKQKRVEPEPHDADLKSFLDEQEGVRLSIKGLLRRRDFGEEQNDVVEQALNFLSDAAAQLSTFRAAIDPVMKTDFLKSLMRAWEVADATGTFNATNVRACEKVREFSAECVAKIAALPKESKILLAEKRYWQELARTGLILVTEYYRAQKLNECRAELNKLLTFVNERLRDEEMTCDGILGQIFYLSSKANRMDGQLKVSEDDLGRAAAHYSERARRISETESRIIKHLARSRNARLEDELRDTRERQLEVVLRTGVVEVSRAWLYFSQCNYKGAQHSARTALLLLSPSSDKLTQYHARLVSAAVDRVTSKLRGNWIRQCRN